MLELFSTKKQEKIRRNAAKKNLTVELYLHSKYANKAANHGYASVGDYLAAKKAIKASKTSPPEDSSSSSSSDSEWKKGYFVLIKIKKSPQDSKLIKIPFKKLHTLVLL